MDLTIFKLFRMSLLNYHICRVQHSSRRWSAFRNQLQQCPQALALLALLAFLAPLVKSALRVSLLPSSLFQRGFAVLSWRPISSCRQLLESMPFKAVDSQRLSHRIARRFDDI